MQIKKVIVKNFRGYKDETTIDFGSLTTFVGKNDVGKSSILEALDIFFNEKNALVNMSKEDLNVVAARNGDESIEISVTFTNLPECIVIDSTNSTTLKEEYLLNRKKELEIKKIYPNGGKEKVFIKAYHPSNDKCKNLLTTKISDLKKILKENSISCSNQTRSADIRKAIWDFFKDDLQLQEAEIEISKFDEKDIYTQIKKYFPLYTLFQSDRKNSDSDSEIQDPMKIAVKQILSRTDTQEKLSEIANSVKSELERIAENTLNKLNEMDSDIAESLSPKLPETEDLKWSDVFKSVTISDNNGIMLNKRGSGIKRLVLLNFFRAEAERRLNENDATEIIYAIEEPETSQHPNYQRELIDSFIQMSQNQHTQIILTTHSPEVVKRLDFSNIRVIKDVSGNKQIENVEKNNLPYPSLNEINYTAFGEPTIEFHNELYGYLQSIASNEDVKNEKEKPFENWLVSKGLGQNKSWIRVQEGVVKPSVPSTLQTYVRNCIHHPENSNNEKFTDTELYNSINAMRKLASELVM